MKGISLTIETVVVLILAVTTMTILLIYLFDVWGKQTEYQTHIENIQMWCEAYVQNDPECSEKGYSTVKTNNPEILKKLVDKACESSPNFYRSAACTGSEASLACIRDCCMFCKNK